MSDTRRVAEWAVDTAVERLFDEFDRIARLNNIDNKTMLEILNNRVGDIREAYEEWISESWDAV